MAELVIDDLVMGLFYLTDLPNGFSPQDFMNAFEKLQSEYPFLKKMNDVYMNGMNSVESTLEGLKEYDLVKSADDFRYRLTARGTLFIEELLQEDYGKSVFEGIEPIANRVKDMITDYCNK